ncbi:hypothetical protein SNEBB_000076 [Seison nebaliae]|nr:hypothetical protein SNEBB_000076 [Seison nebaliae]
MTNKRNILFLSILFISICHCDIIDSGDERKKQKESFGRTYVKALEFYQKNEWEKAAELFELAIHSYKHQLNVFGKCRQICDSTNTLDNYCNKLPGSGTTNCQFFAFAKQSICLRQCSMGKLGDDLVHVPEKDSWIILDFYRRKPYDFLQYTYSMLSLYGEAVSAAFTYLAKNPNEKNVLNRLNEYLEKLSEEERSRHLIDLEEERYQTKYLQAVRSFRKENWSQCTDNFESALLAFVDAHAQCQSECELFESAVVMGSLNYYDILTNIYAKIILCYKSCVVKTSDFRFYRSPHFPALYYEHLHYCYMKQNKFREGCRALSSAIIFRPKNQHLLNEWRKYEYLLPKENVMEDCSVRSEAFLLFSQIVSNQKISNYLKENFIPTAHQFDNDELRNHDEDLSISDNWQRKNRQRIQQLKWNSTFAEREKRMHERMAIKGDGGDEWEYGKNDNLKKVDKSDEGKIDDSPSPNSIDDIEEVLNNFYTNELNGQKQNVTKFTYADIQKIRNETPKSGNDPSSEPISIKYKMIDLDNHDNKHADHLIKGKLKYNKYMSTLIKMISEISIDKDRPTSQYYQEKEDDNSRKRLRRIDLSYIVQIELEQSKYHSQLMVLLDVLRSIEHEMNGLIKEKSSNDVSVTSVEFMIGSNKGEEQTVGEDEYLFVIPLKQIGEGLQFSLFVKEERIELETNEVMCIHASSVRWESNEIVEVLEVKMLPTRQFDEKVTDVLHVVLDTNYDE